MSVVSCALAATATPDASPTSSATSLTMALLRSPGQMMRGRPVVKARRETHHKNVRLN